MADFIADTGATIDHLEDFKAFNYRGFHVIRDPRDIVVSAYFSHKYSHPIHSWLVEQRERLHAVDLEEGIRISIDFREKQFREMENWNYHLPNIYETRFEILIAEPLKIFTDIFTFLGLYPNFLKSSILAEILSFHTFKYHSNGRETGEEDIRHHYRKGMPGDWKDYLLGKNKDHFKNMFGQLLIQLGYERDLNW